MVVGFRPLDIYLLRATMCQVLSVRVLWMQRCIPRDMIKNFCSYVFLPMSELLGVRDCLLAILYHQDFAQGLAHGRRLINVCSINERLNGWMNTTGKNAQMLEGERGVFLFATVISFSPFYIIISHYIKTVTILFFLNNYDKLTIF